jgi:hypothetical protein
MTGRFLALGDAPTAIKPGYKPLIRSMPGLDPKGRSRESAVGLLNIHARSYDLPHVTLL